MTNNQAFSTAFYSVMGAVVACALIFWIALLIMIARQVVIRWQQYSGGTVDGYTRAGWIIECVTRGPWL